MAKASPLHKSSTVRGHLSLRLKAMDAEVRYEQRVAVVLVRTNTADCVTAARATTSHTESTRIAQAARTAWKCESLHDRERGIVEAVLTVQGTGGDMASRQCCLRAARFKELEARRNCGAEERLAGPAFLFLELSQEVFFGEVVARLVLIFIVAGDKVA